MLIIQSTSQAQAGTSEGWVPGPVLSRTDAEVGIFFLAPNGIQFSKPSDDPWFSAHFNVSLPSYASINLDFWLSDEYVNVLACTDQHQYCNPTNSQCTPLTGVSQAFESINVTNMNPIQATTVMRIGLSTGQTSISNSVGGRGASALRALETVNDLSQAPLPPNQWQREVSSWFATGLAKLQQSIVEYAAGPSNVGPGSHVETFDNDPIARALCGSQKVHTNSSTISFSMLDVGIIITLGSIIILNSLVIDTIVGFIQQKWGWGDFRRIRWVMDDKLQVQRMAFEEAGMGREWVGLSSMVPTTKKGDAFGDLEGVDFEKLRLGNGGKKGSV
jgi:hypothetical protein